MTVFGFRPAFWPTLIALPMLIVLGALGTWQLQRLAWKNQLIGDVHAGLAAAAVELPTGALDAAAWAYRRVSLSGRFDHTREFHVLSPGPRGEHGYRIVTPLLRAGRDGGDEAVLVDRGWAPAASKAAETRLAGQIAGVVNLQGVVRQSSRGGWFVPRNDVDGNLWFSADAGAMQQALGRGGPELFVATETLLLAAGGPVRIEFANPHLHYAVIWYALAAALAAIYVLWHRKLPT